MKIFFVFTLVLFSTTIVFSEQSSAPQQQELKETTACSPRFASLRSKNVNSRVGPGNTYPIEWHYARQNLPVEIIAEFDVWRQIRDPDGSISWVHKSLLSGKRHAMILHKNRKLFCEPNVSARVVAIAEPGVIGRLLECRQAWCKIDVEKSQGWVKRRFLSGVYPHEEQKFS